MRADEVDSFLGQRKSQEHEAVTNMKTEFMSLWDGFLTEDTARVMVLAATNRPWEVDEAILRCLAQNRGGARSWYREFHLVEDTVVRLLVHSVAYHSLAWASARLEV